MKPKEREIQRAQWSVLALASEVARHMQCGQTEEMIQKHEECKQAEAELVKLRAYARRYGERVTERNRIIEYAEYGRGGQKGPAWWTHWHPNLNSCPVAYYTGTIKMATSCALGAWHHLQLAKHDARLQIRRGERGMHGYVSPRHEAFILAASGLE